MKILLLIFSLLILQTQAFAAELVLMVIDNNSFLANKAVAELNMSVETQVIAVGELAEDGKEIQAEINQTKVLVVDVMGRELEEYLSNKIDLKNKVIYALRGSTDDERLKKLGFLFDNKVADYYRHISKKNIQNMLRLLANRHFDDTISFAGVVKNPTLGIYHPKAGKNFSTAAEYQNWQKTRQNYDKTKPYIGVLFFSSSLTQGQQKPIQTIINRLEIEGFNVLPCFGPDQQTMEQFLLDENKKARVDLILAFSLKFYSGLNKTIADDLRRLNVPVISAINLYKDTLNQWRASRIGIGGNEVGWSIANPELSGLIEPTPLSAKTKVVDPATDKIYFVSQPIEENIDRLISRLHSWINLQRTPNKDKKIAVMFYNHHQGKQNIGASYLNVFQSLETIMTTLKIQGYKTGDPLSEKEIKSMILTSGRNIGSWAPGELDRLLSSGKVIRLPLEIYKHWFENLPKEFKDGVIQQWGEPEESRIMKSDNNFIIPAVQVENFVMLPEPARGWGDDPMKLYHDTTLYPHHQYLAVYLWLAHKFKADAMIHLGTHSTYEWTPGKQAGLSPSCSPEVLISNIPNIYPYIVDNIGEGIQAKRRGRGVMISHLTPILKKADLYEEYSRMAELVNEYERAKTRNSITAQEKLKELMVLAKKTGIIEDIKNDDTLHQHDEYHLKQEHDYHNHNSRNKENSQVLQDEFIHLLGHYLEDIKENLIPFGMHTFGRSSDLNQARHMADAVLKWNRGLNRKNIVSCLIKSGENEIHAMIQGLNGRYIQPGQGNDPVRNPDALPTGRNFYGFNPNKLPSKAAWELGKQAANEIIKNHLNKHGNLPQKVAIILWATETQRNEGVNESTIMYLIGTKPRWSKTGRVLGIDVIPASQLNRPRIDVMINASGLYRDQFPAKIKFLDRAIRLAARQTDIENLIARHDREIKTQLLKKGMDSETADTLSRFRIFSEEPGSYGTGVAELAGASSKWEKPEQIVDVFEKRIGFVFGEDQWGVAAKEVLKENLTGVDVTLHSRSSNVYGLLDNDDMYQYLGGMSMAVRHESGNTPETLITQQQKRNRVTVEDMAKTLGREMRSRYLNPKWIKGMKKEDYAGAREMAKFVEYLWGWNVTNPEKIDAAKWQQAYEVYVEDKYGLELNKFFNDASPWAYQSITGRMLEATRKGYWKAPQKIKQILAANYARSIIEKTIACCEHTCNNLLLNQMVVSIISIPGVLSPELVDKFKLAVEQMAQKTLEKQVADEKELAAKLASPVKKKLAQNETLSKKKSENENHSQGGEQSEIVEGYKMENMDKKDKTTQMTSSGIEWLAVLTVIAIIGLTVLGARRNGM